MPWQPKDAAAKTTKVAGNPKAQRQWSDVANSVLAKTGDEGLAIREASGVVKKRKLGMGMPRKPVSGLAKIKA